MDLDLTPLEIRVIGCLVEKQITTPDQYPLSLNALVNACNQKSNRDPVLELKEVQVQGAIDTLVARFLVSEERGYGSRVSKYGQRFCNSNFGKLQLTPGELGVLCELFLRGPQTPGELRSRASRLCPLKDVSEVEDILERLATRDDGPFVVRLAREPGRRESRYAQLFGDDSAVQLAGASSTPATAAAPSAGAADEFERRLEQLETEIAELKERLQKAGL